MKKQIIEQYKIGISQVFKKEFKLEIKIKTLAREIKKCSDRGGTTFILGNGGSAAIASHVSVDLMKNAGIRSQNFNEADLITCFSNDFGNDNWMMEALRFYSQNNDLVILISSSGNSENIVRAANYCLSKGIKIITFSGMSPDNRLARINNTALSIWVDSKGYNIIESIHQFLLLMAVDYLIGNCEYLATPKGYSK